MELKTEWEEGALVVMPEGSIDGASAIEFHKALTAATKDTHAPLVMDMDLVTYISSAGLRVILQTTMTLRGRDSRVLLCSLSTRVWEVFEISGFSKIVETHNTRAEAIAALWD